MTKGISRLMFVAVVAMASAVSIAAQEPSQGIKVHGRWTIEVRNPDGTLATRREFNNHLDPGGSMLLTRFLARVETQGTWIVGLVDNLFPSTVYQIYESAATGVPADPNVFRTLTVGVPFGNRVDLNGSFTAASAGSIASVQTYVSRCPSTIAPSSCLDVSRTALLTSATLTLPVPVQQGQIVQITVRISFS